MGLLKYLLLALALIWLWYSPALRGRRSSRPSRSPVPPAAPGKTPTESMVACAHCGVHVPQGDALVDASGRFYCCEAHRQAGQRGH